MGMPLVAPRSQEGRSPRSQVVPGNACREVVPRVTVRVLSQEAKPQELFQVQPGNQEPGNKLAKVLFEKPGFFEERSPKLKMP